MGNSEETKPAKSTKPSSPPVDQANVHVYPDWAAIQAYYGPRVAMPPYYNSSMAASAHPPPPYMWNPQHMMSPYGGPYAAVYPHGGGGVYAHPGVPMGSQLQGQKIPPLTTSGTPLSIDTPTKSTGNTDNGLMKKLKEFDGLAMSLGNGHPDNGVDEHKRSRNSSETEGSSDGSDGNTTGVDEPKLKKSREGTPTKDGKDLVKSSSFHSVSPSSGDNCVKPVEGAGAIVSIGNERELKRERRKQSNRESARRSRLRKQAETEELARKVEALTAENMALRSELNQLNDKSDKLRGANATLMDKLKSSEPAKKVSGNMLSRVKNSGNGDKNKSQGDNDSNSSSKLHQLLETKPRADAVAAG